MNVKGILLDLDDTLYEYEKTHQMALNLTLESIQKQFNLEETVVANAFKLAKKKLKSILPNVAANHSRILYFQLTMEILNINPIPSAYNASNTYWNEFLNKMVLSDDAIKFLDVYKNIPICLVTDLTAEIQYKKLERLGLTDSFTHIVTSEEAGVEKPHPFMFKLALSKLNFSADEVVMIGDNYNKDVVGANLLGIRSFWLNRDKKVNKDLLDYCTEVHSLTEIDLK
jgi:putative hydrolase of the HAD superfamily